MSFSRYAVFRYSIHNDESVAARDIHFDEFAAVKGKKAPYRVREPEERDYKNFVFDLRQYSDDPLSPFSFGVGYRLDSRVELQFDERTEQINPVVQDANDMRYTRAVFLPELQVCAFKDGSGNLLNAIGGAGRVSSILDIYSEFYFEYEATANKADIDAALRKLRLLEMRFEVRPFNPHPKTPGNLLHELLSTANIGNMTAVAKPHEGAQMSADVGGMVSEAAGLAAGGYGHYGIKAETENGALVSYKKKKLHGDREKDRDLEEKPRYLYVSVPATSYVTDEALEVIIALKEIFSKDG